MVAGAPTANANIAAQGHVQQSPQEQQAAYDQWLKTQLATTQQQQSYYNQYQQSDQSYNDLVNSLALSGEAPKDYVSKNVSPTIMQGPGVTDSLNGKTIDRSALYWAHDQAAAARDATRQGQAYVPAGADSSGYSAAWSNPAVQQALQAYNSTASTLPQVDTMGNYGANVQPGVATHQMDFMNFNGLGPQIANNLALGTQGVNSFNQNIQDIYGNAISNGQGYLNAFGGGFAGGVSPYALNPSWANTTSPQWQAPSFASNGNLQNQAQNSPFGQAGAPFQQQAWAGGILNPTGGLTPTQTNPFATIGMDPVQAATQTANQANQQQPQAAPFFNNTFATNTPTSSNLASNAPWGSPYQTATPNNTAGASPWFATPSGPNGQQATGQQNSLTFGQSPWGSSWG